MLDGKTLCLNMIVKNEMANLDRCLGSIAPHIGCWAIGDTGSTDGTQQFIKSFFAERGIPGELHGFPFINFEQARNAALDCAYASPLQYDYLLFCDADMELVVEDPNFRGQLEAPSCQLLQRSSISYWNTRLVRRDAGARYRGVTHEYIDLAGKNQRLSGAWYKDHASGANRVDKFERDIRLLSEALKTEPENHRYQFYLAQSLRDAGRAAEAVKAYGKRVEMGGWDEEAWNARLQQARCLRKLGDDAGFLSQAVAAFNQRPQRAEPLYDLARFYREKGMNDASLLFSERGLAIECPEQDVLFLEDFVYSAGLREEYSIAANYARDPARKDRGFAACNWLALNRSIPDASRGLAWTNQFFYLQPISAMALSFTARPVAFAPPDGYRPMNPSIARLGDRIVLAQRAVNFTVLEVGQQYHTPDGEPVKTRNFLLRLTNDLAVESAAEILAPADWPEPANTEVLGFEDFRLFAWRGELWGSACVRELTAEGWCEQVLARIDECGGAPRLTDWRVLQPEGPRDHQKNWMPHVAGDRLQFIYLCDPTRLVDEHGRTIVERTPPIAAKEFRGGSQTIPFGGGSLALIHEARLIPAEQRRAYQHRFVWLDATGSLKGVSRPFFFHKKGHEFAAGLAWAPDGKRLLISYGVGDGEAWIATIEAGEVRNMLDDAEHLPSGAPAVGSKAEPHLRLAEETVEPVATPRERDVETVERSAPASPPTLAAETSSEAAEEPGAAPAIEPPSKGSEPLDDRAGGAAQKSTEQTFLELAPFLLLADSPQDRRRLARPFDERIAPLLDPSAGAALPQIHCFYEVLSDSARHDGLIAATSSMRAVGHPVRVWTYSPPKLEFLAARGIEVRDAAAVFPKSLFDRILSRFEIRYFSDVFRYAALYEHGGLYMDADVILLRPFPFRGDHFFNLQWRAGWKDEHKQHFVCGNVIYAEPFSRHMRNLYEMAIDRFHASSGWAFGDVGPKLLSDYIASDAGAELRERVFSPVFFNSIDWTENDRFNQPMSELADYLNDERVFGVHLWNARTNPRADAEDPSLIAMLSDPLARLPGFATLADKFNTDKNRHTGNRHFYSRIYDRLLSPRRFSLRRLMEIGLCRGLAERNQPDTPSVKLWQTYFPFCQVIGVDLTDFSADLTDFSALINDRFASFVCDQSKPDELRGVAAKLEPGSLDVIIDDGSHASYDEQLTLREFFPLLADGGWYFIQSLDWQPPGEDSAKIALTKHLLREIQEHGRAQSTDPLGLSNLAGQFAEILFFDSHYELARAKLMGGLVAIRKRGGTALEPSLRGGRSNP